MTDPGLRIGFLSAGAAPDYGLRLSRLRWRRRFPGRPASELAPEGIAADALAAARTWVLVRDETALPTPGAPPETSGGRVVLATPLSPAAAPFVHTLRELEETTRPGGSGDRRVPRTESPALAFSTADFPPREGETVAAFVHRLVSPPTPHEFAPGFAAVTFEGAPGEAGERAEVIRLLPSAVLRLLDVGCASGEAGGAIRRRDGAQVTGIERDPASAERARTRLDRVIEGEAPAVLADLVRAGERFDAFLFADVLEHFDDPIGALALARELATPGATLVASVPNVGHLSLVRDLVLGRFDPLPAGLADAAHLRWFTRASLGEALEEAGWHPVSIDASPGAPPPDAGPFLERATTWSGANADGLLAYQWLAVARPR